MTANTRVVHQPVSGAAHPGLVEDCALCAARRGPATPDIDLTDEIRYAALVAVHGAWPTDSNHVADWHSDDQAVFRNTDWDSFTARNAAVLTERQQRVTDAVLAAVLPAIRRQWEAEEPGPSFMVTCDDEGLPVKAEYLGRTLVHEPAIRRHIPDEQRQMRALEGDAEPYEPQVHRSTPRRPRTNPDSYEWLGHDR